MTSTAGKIWGREPAMWSALINAFIYLLGALVFNFSPEMESLLIAVTAAVLGIVVAWQTQDGLSAAILGFTKAFLALLLGFGLNVGADQQALVLSFVAAATAMFVRTQASAPVQPKEGSGVAGDVRPEAVI
ncbi:hypothetical protein [Actinoplanes solisilvae]|uniref:hypothetical protein n=1 Tax=Actinoplanes solisilvae TaxID=2486853 RepID=UPI000FD76EDD|nr:hypothetical protein [Actinoplanes solisilvae]